MKAQSSRVSITESPLAKKPTESLDETCKCDVMQPGLYDIETEMCTPELDDAKQYIPPEIQNNILEKTPVNLFLVLEELMPSVFYFNNNYFRSRCLLPYT